MSAARVAEAAQTEPGRQQGLLEHIFGVLGVRDLEMDIPGERLPVRADELGERLFILPCRVQPQSLFVESSQSRSPPFDKAHPASKGSPVTKYLR